MPIFKRDRQEGNKERMRESEKGERELIKGGGHSTSLSFPLVACACVSVRSHNSKRGCRSYVLLMVSGFDRRLYRPINKFYGSKLQADYAKILSQHRAWLNLSLYSKY